MTDSWEARYRAKQLKRPRRAARSSLTERPSGYDYDLLCDDCHKSMSAARRQYLRNNWADRSVCEDCESSNRPIYLADLTPEDRRAVDLRLVEREIEDVRRRIANARTKDELDNLTYALKDLTAKRDQMQPFEGV